MAHTILIVDSEPVQRDLLVHALQNRLGYRTVTTGSLSEAVPHFYVSHALRPDLILLDWSIEDSDNRANLRALSIQAPVVVLVKYGDYDSAKTALACGAQDFLAKPVGMERISTTFRNILLLRDARREVEKLRTEHMQEGAGQQTRHEGISGAFSFPLIGEDGNMRRMEEIEAESIRFAMQYYHGRMTEVARRLGIGRSTLYRKLNEIGIGREQEAA